MWRWLCWDRGPFTLHCFHYHKLEFTVRTPRKNCEGPPDEEGFAGYGGCCHCEVVRMTNYGMDYFKYLKELPDEA
jgi:hypothetical protein